jgi:hypothetical protein
MMIQIIGINHYIPVAAIQEVAQEQDGAAAVGAHLEAAAG